MDSPEGLLDDPPGGAREQLLLRLMRENGDYRLRNEQLERQAVRPHELQSMLESLNRMIVTPGSAVVRDEAERTLLKLLGMLSRAEPTMVLRSVAAEDRPPRAVW